MARLYKTTGEVETIAPASGLQFTLKELQSYVGGYIEIVYLPLGELLVCNEEGKLIDLPVNILASRVAGVLMNGDCLHCGPTEID